VAEVRGWIVGRLLALVAILAAISMVTFALLALIPGDPATVMLGAEASRQSIAQLHKDLGLDRPLPFRFAIWLRDALHGNLGYSIFSHRAVSAMIAERLSTTLTLCLLALIIAVVVGVSTGVLGAVRQDGAADQLVRLFQLVGLSVPDFWLGILLLLVFSVQLRLVPLVGYKTITESFWTALRFLALPAFALGLVQAANVARMTRAYMLEVLRQDYVRTARAKGLGGRRIIYRHALRNALPPVVTVLGIQVGALLSGVVVVETVFGLPGIGQLVLSAILTRDYPLIQGVMLYTAVIYALANLVVDVSYGVMDPRVREAG
jgi:peptide/nickel transport system permease protein